MPFQPNPRDIDALDGLCSAYKESIDAAVTAQKADWNHLEAWRLIKSLENLRPGRAEADPTDVAVRVMTYPHAATVAHALAFLCEKIPAENIALPKGFACEGTWRAFALNQATLARELGLTEDAVLKALRMMQRHRAVKRFRRKHGLLRILCDLRTLDAFIMMAAIGGYRTEEVMHTSNWRRALRNDYTNETAYFDPEETSLPKWSYEI